MTLKNRRGKCLKIMKTKKLVNSLLFPVKLVTSLGLLHNFVQNALIGTITHGRIDTDLNKGGDNLC